ncbi:MAG: penicillin acylase family protein [Acidobacteriota bacterium]
MPPVSLRRPLSAPLLCLLLSLILFGALPAAAQNLELPGLNEDALVVRDSNDVPHICARSDRDALYMLGYLHAQDRFFQMDNLRRLFSGTLAEVMGPAVLASDVQFRTLGLRRAAEASLVAYQERGLDEALSFFEAYTAGINAYLASNPLPPEYGALELTQSPAWTVVDSLTVGKGLAFGLSFDLLELDLTLMAGAYGQAGAVGGFDGLSLLLDDVMRQAPIDDRVSIPSGAGIAAAPQTAGAEAAKSTPAIPSQRTAALARSLRDRMAEIPELEKTLSQRRDDTGSNWWLVDPSRSASGHAMLANDPHLGLDTPSTFYEVHLIASSAERCGIAAAGSSTLFVGTGPGASQQTAAQETGEPAKNSEALDATGVSFPGAPGLVQGCNLTMCWGSTVNRMDVTDVFQETLVFDPASGLPTHTVFAGEQEPLVLIPQVFNINQVGDGAFNNLADAGLGPLDGGLTLVVPRRNSGPILDLDVSASPPIGLSVQYVGWQGTTEFAAFFSWLRATSIEDFRSGLQFFDVGSQNWAYADIAGNIAYFTSGELPIRDDLQNLGFPDGGVPPFFIRNGSGALRHEWMTLTNPQPEQTSTYEILPFDEMPQEINPGRGYIANANNDPIGTTLDNNSLNQVRAGGGIFYLNSGYPSLRMGRIDRVLQELLANDGKATRQDLEVLQGNNELLGAELLSPFLTAAFTNASAGGAPAALAALAADPEIAEAISRIAAWDFSTPTGLTEGYDPGDDPANLAPPSATEIANSVAATIWSTFRGQAIERAVDGPLTAAGLGDFLPDNRSALVAFANLLTSFETNQGLGQSGFPFLRTGQGLTPAEDRDFILLSSLRAALDLLASDTFAPAFAGSTNQEDYRWGLLHRIVFEHPLGGPFNVPPAGGFSSVSPELPGLARSGGYEAVDASRHNSRANGPQEFMFSAGPARRFVGVLNPAGIEARQVIPGGQSGVLGDPNYASQLGLWLTNDYHDVLFTPEAIAADQVEEQSFDPYCGPVDSTLCFQNQSFAASIAWNNPNLGTGVGRRVPGASNVSGNFAFFSDENWEMLVKVLDGCSLNGHFWVFASGATDVGWELRVEDTATGATFTATNPQGTRSPAVTATEAFPCQ